MSTPDAKNESATPAAPPAATYHGITKAECLGCGYTSTNVTEMEMWNDYGVTCIRDCGSDRSRWTLVDGTVRTVDENGDDA